MDFSSLKFTEMFSGLSEDEIKAALHCINAKEKPFHKDEYILRTGESVSSMGIIISGSALIIQEDIWGHRNIISKLGHGDTFAEPFAAADGMKLNISVVAESDCTVLFISMNRIMTTCANTCDFHNRIIRNLVSILGRKLLMFNDKITHVSKRNTRSKILSFLSAESQRQGTLSFDITFDRQTLADYLCVERAAMSVVLSDLQKEGLIKYKRNHFEILIDPDEM